MTVSDLSNLYEYSCWANNKLFGVISKLTPEEFTRPVSGSYGSVRNTLVHTLSAEWAWMGRCGGVARGERLVPETYPTLEALIETWSKVEGYMRDLLSDLTEEDLDRQVEYIGGSPEPRSMPIGELLHHVMNHGAHHRGQVALLLRELGHAPVDVDLLFYFAEKRGVKAW